MYAATHVNSSTGSFLTQWSGSRSRTASKLYLNLPHHVTEAQINAHWLSACPAYFGGRRGLPGCATCQQYGEHREVCVLRMEWGIGCALTISCFMVVWSSASRPEDGSLCTISTRISFLADTTPLRFLWERAQQKATMVAIRTRKATPAPTATPMMTAIGTDSASSPAPDFISEPCSLSRMISVSEPKLFQAVQLYMVWKSARTMLLMVNVEMTPSSVFTVSTV